MSTDSIGNTPPTNSYYVAPTTTGSSGGKADLQSILDTVMASQINEQTEYVEGLAGQVNALNIKMANDNAAMEVANACTNAPSTCSGSTTFPYTDPTTGATSEMTLSNFDEANGIPLPNMDGQGTWGSSAWSTEANNLQTDAGTLSNDSQLLNIDLQTGMNNLSNTNQMLSTVNKNFTDTNTDIIRNM